VIWSLRADRKKLRVPVHGPVWIGDPTLVTGADDVDRSMMTVDGLDDLVALFEAQGGRDLYVRWSKGPAADLGPGMTGVGSSRDGLTGVLLPGLSANPLQVEPWWQDRSVRLWIARRLYDYRHLRDLRGPGVRPWVLRGAEVARGPDNEPLVTCHEALAWVGDAVLKEAEQLVDEQHSGEWGSMDRRAAQ
jgi:hypothetical protein